jgi:M6 family metalloprotease-like protein
MKKTLTLAVSLVLIGSVLTPHAFASVKPGTKCFAQGQTKNWQGKKYTCIKSGKKLVWNKGVASKAPTTSQAPYAKGPSNPYNSDAAPTPSPAVADPTPQPVQTFVYSPPTQPGSAIEQCKIKENNSNRIRWADSQLPTGFPSFTHAIKTGTVKWALIPIDFSDLPGEAGFRSRVDDQMKMASDWFETVSEGKFKVEWVVADNWVRLPKPTSEYKIDRSDNLERVPNAVKLWNDAMGASDKVFDFSGIQTVNFILPKGQDFVQETLQGFPWQPEVKQVVTNEGGVSSFSIPGRYFDSANRQYWSYWVHEFGHSMALPHIGSSREENPFMGLDIMSNQDGESKELSGWMRFVAGWLPDEKVYCAELSKLESTEIILAPLSEKLEGVKMVVVPISQTRAVIIESRRENKFTCTMPSKRNGVLVYTYDATLSHGENFLKPAVISGRSPERSSNCSVAAFPNPILYKDEEIVAEGVRIEVLASANYDKVRISRKG